MKRLLTERINNKFTLYRLSGRIETGSFAKDVLNGLSSKHKYLLPKYFYDEKGSKLFEDICTTPEYYLTRTETKIIENHAEEFVSDNCNRKIIIELGSGFSIKTRLLLSAFLKTCKGMYYMPIDVSDVIIPMCNQLTNYYDDLNAVGIISEYEDGLNLIKDIVDQPALFLFLGSSIGNFSLKEAIDFIKFISSCLHHHDNLLIGFDMVKDKSVLNAAYNDEAGYTEQFNKNLLVRINDELGGQFDISLFRHHAFYNDKKNRIEMHLVSHKNQSVYIDALEKEFYFGKGESIHTENSYKFTDKMIENITKQANLKTLRKFNDENKYFSLMEFQLD